MCPVDEIGQCLGQDMTDKGQCDFCRQFDNMQLCQQIEAVGGPCQWIFSHEISAEHCEDYSGCTWQTSAWSKCDTTCGFGKRTREVWCAGGECDLEKKTSGRYVVPRNGRVPLGH
jgi:hypothetical protein